jgi:Novel STAND NTPase 1
MKSPAGDARVRLPREPYPGLRPFLDFEAALLFGRDRQVREVIERLQLTQFVAVIGGSGSGKSSLIHAGVVPALRSFGIPGAGDLWLPMTCTPGTNVSAADSAARRHTPVTRLARRFAGLLRTRGSESADAERVQQIAEVFRQEAGFSRLLETFGSALAVPPGPDPGEARVLFVLDQFEEIFHPTNQGVGDAALLVERVLDHFFDPHPHCHVVLTMRSEHLNDCAAYLELPDAINKSSYLIRRLDPDELREAIVGPAQRFLRLMARSAPPGTALPEQVVFEPAVLARLLRDVQAITHDPDHLPLLQHLLARLWQAALEREEVDVPVPSRIAEADLVRAVTAGPQGDERPLDERLNTLRACVENWPETIYRWHGAAERAQLDALFRRLAFKDPNTGLYSQQRVDVQAGARLLGEGKTPADLRALVAEGFLGSVDYLFWDDEDPERVTLKVSHESFIRGWARFRHLVDEDSTRFDEFVALLRRCADWSDSGRSEDFLLETGELRRLADSGFAARLRRGDQRSTWLRFVAVDRDGARLSRVAPELDDYLAASERRQHERLLRETRGRRSARALLAFTVVLGLLPTALFSVFVQGPTLRRAELLFDAGNRANRVTLSPSQYKVGDAAGTLDSLLRAAELIDDARSGEASLRLSVSKALLQTLGSWPLFSDQRDFLGSVFAQAEPPVNGTLRQLLTTAVWHADAEDAATAARAPRQALRAPQVFDDAPCTAPAADGGALEQLRGRLFVPRRRDAADPRPLRALFVPARPAFDRSLEVFSASVDPLSDVCLLGTIVFSTPDALASRVVFDAGLRYLYYTAEGRENAAPAVIVQEIDWERSGDGRVRALQRQTLTSITDPAAVAAVREAAGPGRAAVVPTWWVPGGRIVDIDGRRWRLVGAQAQRIAEPPEAGAMAPLQPAAPGSPCARLAATFAEMKGFRIDSFEHGGYCFRIARGWPAFGGGDGAQRPARDELRVSVHESPSPHVLERAAESPPAPVAGLVPFARVAEEDAAGTAQWFVGTSGSYAGWLLLRSVGRAGEARFIGLPWSTCALWRLGRDLQGSNPPPGPQRAGVSPACTGR